MDITEFYGSIGVDPHNVLNRLGNGALIKKYLIKFYHDPSYQTLRQSLENNDYAEAFRAAHTIKGICLNLELSPLTKLAVELSDILRSYTPDREKKLAEVFESFAAAYIEIVDRLKELQ